MVSFELNSDSLPASITKLRIPIAFDFKRRPIQADLLLRSGFNDSSIIVFIYGKNLALKILSRCKVSLGLSTCDVCMK